MKQITAFILAGLIGGFVSFALLKNQLKNQIIIEEGPQVVQTSTTNALNSIPTDFITASEKATKAVVQINSSQSKDLAQKDQQQRRQNNPFFGFDDFFGGGRMDGLFRKEGAGSGVIISSDGLIVTNNHVVGFADEFVVTLNDGRKLSAKKIGTDNSSDLALIKIEGDNFPTLSFADSDEISVGEWVLAVGNPMGNLTSTVTAGIVSALGRDIDIIQGKNGKGIEEFIQTDAAVNPGNSGGALVDAKGNLIGINTAIATGTGYYTGYSFAIPSNLASKIVDQILATGGDIERANLGLRVSDVQELKDNNEPVDYDYGVFVGGVDQKSSAQYAGVLPGDIIVNVNGAEVYNFEDLKESLKFTKVGDTVRLKVIRKGKRETIPVKLRG